MFEVVYYSLTGNTKKVAEAIADELSVTAVDVKSKDRLADDSFVFLGTGLYGPLRAFGFRRFIDRNDFEGRGVALFGTSGEGRGKEVDILGEAVAAKGAEMKGKFYTKGEFVFLGNRNHPSRSDLKSARAFAREITEDGYG